MLYPSLIFDLIEKVKDAGILEEMASGVVGTNVFKEIIVYCGVGGYASTMYFVLSEVFGYKNVKIYDGSEQEWTMLGLPVVLMGGLRVISLSYQIRHHRYLPFLLLNHHIQDLGRWVMAV